MNVFQILVRNLYNGVIVNIYFVFIDQVKKKVQRSFKHRKLYWYRHVLCSPLRFPDICNNQFSSVPDADRNGIMAGKRQIGSI